MTSCDAGLPSHWPWSGSAQPWSRSPRSGRGIVAVGHFNDHRAIDCPPGDLQFCLGVFVIDTVAFAGDRELLPVRLEDPGLGPPSLHAAAVEETLGSVYGLDATILWIAALRGADLPGYEDRAPVMAARDIGWLAQVIDRGADGTSEPRMRSVLVSDVTGQVLWSDGPDPAG